MHYSCRQLTYSIPGALFVGDTVSFGRTEQRYTYIGPLVSDKGTTLVWESNCRTCSVPFRIYTATDKTSGVCRNCHKHREPKGHSRVDKDHKPSKPYSAAPVADKVKPASAKETSSGQFPTCPANCLTPAMRSCTGLKRDKLIAWLFTCSPLERNEKRFTMQEFKEALTAYYNTLVDNPLEDMI